MMNSSLEINPHAMFVWTKLTTWSQILFWEDEYTDSSINVLQKPVRMSFDDVLRQIGEFGPYQIGLYCLLSLLGFPAGNRTLSEAVPFLYLHYIAKRTLQSVFVLADFGFGFRMKLCFTNSFTANACIFPKLYNRLRHQPHCNLIIHHTKYFLTLRIQFLFTDTYHQHKFVWQSFIWLALNLIA